MLSIVTGGPEIAARYRPVDTLYDCAAKLTLNFIETYQPSKKRPLSKVKVRFKYHRFGITKPRRTVTRVKPTDKAVVLLSGKDNWKTIDHAANCRRLYVGAYRGLWSLQAERSNLSHSSFVVPQHLLLCMNDSTKKKKDLVFSESKKDISLFNKYGINFTNDRARLRECKFSIIKSPELIYLSLGVGCLPLVWDLLNRFMRPGFDIKGGYIDRGDKFSRCHSKQDILNKLNSTSEQRAKKLNSLTSRVLEDLPSLNTVQESFNSKLLSFHYIK